MVNTDLAGCYKSKDTCLLCGFAFLLVLSILLFSSDLNVQLIFQFNMFWFYILTKLYSKIIQRANQFYILNYTKYHCMITTVQAFWQSAQVSKFLKIFQSMQLNLKTIYTKESKTPY